MKMKTNEEGKFIIKANEKDYVMVEQHVRKGKLCYSASLSRCVTDATSFATKEDTQEIIDNLWLVYGDEVLTYKILDREAEKASADAEAERKRRNSNIRSWQKTPVMYMERRPNIKSPRFTLTADKRIRRSRRC